MSKFVQSHIVVSPGGHVDIGDQVSFNYGIAMACKTSIKIGSRCRIGALTSITDSNFHSVHNHWENLKHGDPIVIEDDVWVGRNVIILPGVTIGKGAVIGSGSLVNKDIPPGVVAAGIPAKPRYEIKAPEDS